MRIRKRFTAMLLALAFVLTTVIGGISVHASEDFPLVGSGTNHLGMLQIEKKDAAGNPLAGAGFSLYKIMDLTPRDATDPLKGYDFSITSGFETVLGDLDPDVLGNYSTAQIEALTQNILTRIETAPTIAATVTTNLTDENGYTEAIAGYGYYLVVETTVPANYTGSQPFFVALPSTDNYAGGVDGEGNPIKTPGKNWLSVITVKPKNSLVSVTKQITNANNDHEYGTDFTPDTRYKNSDTVAVGDLVTYQITASVPAYTADYFANAGNPSREATFILRDVLSPGLQLVDPANSNKPYAMTPLTDILVRARNTTTSAEVTLEKDVDYEILAVNATGNDPDLTVKLTQAFLANPENHGKLLIVDYAAKVTSDAVIGIGPDPENPGNPNKVWLTYNNAPNVTTKTADIIKRVFTFQLNIGKINEQNIPLAGAKFDLYKAALDGEEVEGVWTEIPGARVPGTKIAEGIETTNTGLLQFPRVDAGTYFLVETESPAGYKLLTSMVKIQIEAPKDVNGDTNGVIKMYVDGKEITAAEQTVENPESYVCSVTGVAHLTVVNRPGFTLPATGGMGIAIFLAVAFIGMISVTVFLVKKKRAQA